MSKQHAREEEEEDELLSIDGIDDEPQEDSASIVPEPKRKRESSSKKKHSGKRESSSKKKAKKVKKEKIPEPSSDEESEIDEKPTRSVKAAEIPEEAEEEEEEEEEQAIAVFDEALAEVGELRMEPEDIPENADLKALLTEYGFPTNSINNGKIAYNDLYKDDPELKGKYDHARYLDEQDGGKKKKNKPETDGKKDKDEKMKLKVAVLTEQQKKQLKQALETSLKHYYTKRDAYNEAVKKWELLYPKIAKLREERGKRKRRQPDADVPVKVKKVKVQVKKVEKSTTPSDEDPMEVLDRNYELWLELCAAEVKVREIVMGMMKSLKSKLDE